MGPRKFRASPWATDSRRKKMSRFRLKERIRQRTAMKPEPLWAAAGFWGEAQTVRRDQRGSSSVSPSSRRGITNPDAGICPQAQDFTAVVSLRMSAWPES